MSFADLLLPGLAKARATEAVAAFVKTCPPPNRVATAISKGSAEKALASLYEGVSRLAHEHRFGIIRRACIAKFVQEEMLAEGYPVEMVSVVTHAITTNALVKHA
ncbi:MAG: hypothetical protein HY066_02380 [Betaproteobacteria bacterium]|nr:hypothetical protein [Betaproteobacteria bacterium]